MEHCLQYLAHAPQWIGDKVLVSQIKFQRVIDQIPRSLREKSEPEVIIPVIMTLHGHLQEVHTNLSQELKENSMWNEQKKSFFATCSLLLTVDILLLSFYSVKLLVDEIEFNNCVSDAGKITTIQMLLQQGKCNGYNVFIGASAQLMRGAVHSLACPATSTSSCLSP